LILKTKRLQKHFGGIYALNNCDLNIRKNEITAIIGPNGSGKSTLFNVISKILKKDKGKIIFNGMDIDNKKDYELASKGISRTFQEVRLFKNLTIMDHIDIAISKDDESILRSLTKKVNRTERIKEILDVVGLNKPIDTFASDLSYGQRKLLDLAMAIAKPGDLLMLDEPVAGVNPKLRKKIKDIIRSLHKKGKTILIIEHDMNFVMDLAGHVIVMNAGKVIAQGRPKDIQNNPDVLNIYLGD